MDIITSINTLTSLDVNVLSNKTTQDFGMNNMKCDENSANIDYYRFKSVINTILKLNKDFKFNSLKSYLKVNQVFIEYAKFRIQEKLPKIKPAIQNQLCSLLGKRLLSVTRSVINLEENRLSEKREINSLNSFFHKYPMLAHVCTRITVSFINAVVRLLSRLANDKNQIKTQFGIDIENLIKIDIDGDFHYGAATTILIFDDNQKLVYKPRDISITTAYNQFVDWVNKKLDISLKTFSIIVKGNYGWIQYIQQKECISIEEVTEYFEHAGVLLGVAYFINARDFHSENVIACGNSPVLIDHEMIISPKVKMSPPKNIDEKKQNEIIVAMDSVMSSSLIPNIYDDSSIKSNGFNSSIIKKNRPYLNGKPCNINDFEHSFLKGFKKLYFLMYEEKKYLSSKHSIVDCFKNKTIRFLNRQTIVYFKIIKTLNGVKYLSDAKCYMSKLEILRKAYIELDYGAELVMSEMKQIMNGDIPIFLFNSSSKYLEFSTGKRITPFINDAVENIRRKIRRSSLKDYNSQVEHIKKSLRLLKNE